MSDGLVPPATRHGERSLHAAVLGRDLGRVLDDHLLPAVVATGRSEFLDGTGERMAREGVSHGRVSHHLAESFRDVVGELGVAERAGDAAREPQAVAPGRTGVEVGLPGVRGFPPEVVQERKRGLVPRAPHDEPGHASIAVRSMPSFLASPGAVSPLSSIIRVITCSVVVRYRRGQRETVLS